MVTKSKLCVLSEPASLRTTPASLLVDDLLRAEKFCTDILGVEFVAPPQKVPGGTRIATFDETCGNFIQIYETRPD